MLHHVSIGVADVARAAEFYDAVLGALGYKRTAQYLPYAIGYGEGTSEFWVQLPQDTTAPKPGDGAHFGFAAKNQAAVHRFHESALANGATDNGAPGPRPDYGPDYYGAFAIDPFGNKIEAVVITGAAKLRSRRASAAKPARKAAAKKSSTRKTKTKRKAKAPRMSGSRKRKARRR